MLLTPAMFKYILHWGEMGTRWGVSRSVAQIHALLYLADAPLPADEIASTLEIARSNVSTGLKELIGWELVRLTHKAGDRRDHFEAKQDPWDMLVTIAEGRKRREIDPTLALLEDCLREARTDGETSAAVRAKLERLRDLTQQLAGWYDQMRHVPRPVLMKLVGLGARIAGFVNR
ncbi:MAG TPA: MarR family transcriptional regulator [Caulobacteraceae bacterium]|jgi:DNA-binding transcriptional regulator GbsR (MarR family)|nr:MarR family transcriptional regulator [Caulobacteraceae bacterium]